MLNPISTYRIQFHKDFTFKNFNLILPYLEQLGITTIYASPILQAAPGSMHGYDTVNPHQINPEIGTLEELQTISKKLKKKGIKWIQDIVPNHMAFQPDNIWLMDVMEKGAESRYAGFFDINWSGDQNKPLMVPFLDSTLEEAIRKGRLKLVKIEDQIKLKYNDILWPVNAAVTSVDMPLPDVMKLQYYRLCSWKETNHQINYRRFFTVNSLICLNIQHQDTFDTYHLLIKKLLDDGIFDGLRVDHIDGLYDPKGYLDRLRALAGKETYIVVEKILEQGEEMPSDWPIEGSTGYDFLAVVNGLFTNRKAEFKLTNYYERLSGDQKKVSKQILQKKAAVLQNDMGGELDNLYELFLGLNLVGEQELNNLKEGALKEAIGQLLIHCPVYRFYGNQLPLSGENLLGLKSLISKISSTDSLAGAGLILENVFINIPEKGDQVFNIRASQFYIRCMQFSGPLMAKGVEDTLMYTYSRFIAHNEVGDAPSAFGFNKKVIHNWMWKRQKEWPLAMNATATHDTKRGEDVRARLNVLSDLPKEWIDTVSKWEIINYPFTGPVDHSDVYFIYQTLIGSYPMPGMPVTDYKERLLNYIEKVLREGKRDSNWADPNLNYEKAVKDFAVQLLDPATDFWKGFEVLHQKVCNFGILNSLGQLLMKFTCPGNADIYQGTELWDLSLVDPDNRRPVNYAERMEMLKEINASGTFLHGFWEERFNGKIKLCLHTVLLRERKLNPELFNSGAYIPLKVKGKHSKNVFAFARKKETEWIITIIPLHLAKLVEEEDILNVDWKDTKIVFPTDAPLVWENLLTGKTGEGKLLKDILADFPLALLKMKTRDTGRSAGVLLSVTSLPSAYGIGDLGNEARGFVDFLCRSGQRFWQLLPLNPIDESQAFSPYSSVSAMAGNILLISPGLLVEDGLLKEKHLKEFELPLTGTVDFIKVAKRKKELLVKAYENFKAGSFTILNEQFGAFCENERYWLDDFTLFTALKDHHHGLPWYKWEIEFVNKDSVALEQLTLDHTDELRFIRWQQFVFYKQWAGLKEYAGLHGVKLYGDLPFYLSYDSVEVWRDREIFSVNKAGEMTGVAGVPPDYFNEDGQLWGMPVYNWDQLKLNGYQWWIQRIKRNMELYDLLRLDHFRAFADYWEVPAGEQTAINGVWKIGPDNDFMNILATNFPDLPFIAEDLGKISPAVYALRDNFKLAGMKVLQFAFNGDMANSEHIPHCYSSANFVVYTGTHDNNTTVGWFKEEATKEERKNLQIYTGKVVTVKNVHLLLTRIAYASIAKIAILPMQDVLGLDGDSRMNKPASVKGNWGWRLQELPPAKVDKKLRQLGKVYGRV